LLPRVPEEDFGLPIDEGDVPVAINDDHGIRGHVHDGAEAVLHRALAGPSVHRLIALANRPGRRGSWLRRCARRGSCGLLDGIWLTAIMWLHRLYGAVTPAARHGEGRRSPFLSRFVGAGSCKCARRSSLLAR